MTYHNRSAEPVGGHRHPLRLIVPIPPRASPRACLEAQIDFLLEMLDRIDGDPDLEETGDLEPYLAGPPDGPGIAPDAEADTSDDEPSLGSLDRQADQRLWNGGSPDDRELDGSDGDSDAGDPLGFIVEHVPIKRIMRPEVML